MATELSGTTAQTAASDDQALLAAAKTVLQTNDHQGQYTIPAHGLYPHQWLWDSCFIAIGLRHYNLPRAQKELRSLLKGQWSNGMLPNMILNRDFTHHTDREFWRSYVSPFAPDGVSTSGITQPPMLADAVVQVGALLPRPQRRTWYQQMYPALVRYHQWLYNERDPHHEGITLQIHPWETGTDNTPPWISELHQHRLPFWITAAHALKLDNVLTFFRRDVHFLASAVEQRMSTVDVFTLYSIQRRLRRKAYDINGILSHAMLTIEDITFNSILVRANHQLRQIAKTIGRQLPEELYERMRLSERALETLWDDKAGYYFSRNYATQQLIPLATIGSLLPLYAGTISQERAEELARKLNSSAFHTAYPVPTVPTTSPWFHEHMYWQGPTWLNMNWLLVDGLRRYGFSKEADHIAQKSVAMVKKSGFAEYFSPRDASPAGTDNFSWTAALLVDFLAQLPDSKATKPGSE